MEVKRRNFFSGLFIKKSLMRLDLGFYWFFAALRVVLTLIPQTGYIHPDEYFQSAEFAAGDVFKTEVSLPWEFNTTFPIRSIPLIYLTLRVPLSITKIFLDLIELCIGVVMVSPYMLLVTERLSMCALSFVSDYCLFKICYLYGQNYKERLMVFASSFVTLVFLTRTFTNTLETVCFNILLYLVASCMAESEKVASGLVKVGDLLQTIGLCVSHPRLRTKEAPEAAARRRRTDMGRLGGWTGLLYLYNSVSVGTRLDLFCGSIAEFKREINYQNGYLKEKFNEATTIVDRIKITKLLRLLPQHSLRRCISIACVTVAGFFNRPTFLLYAIAPLFFWVQRGLSADSTFRKDFNIRIFVLMVYCLPVFGFFILCDSVYYGYLTWGEMITYQVDLNNFVITPLNFLKYNLDSSNLSKHGLHPRFLHLFINIPLLFNVLGLSGLVVIFKILYRGSFSQWTLLPKSQSITGMMTLSLIVPVLGLSLFPHQEPRFIIPVLVPLVFLYSHLLVSFEEDCALVVPFRKRHPLRRPAKGMMKLPAKCLEYLEHLAEPFDNRFNIHGRYLNQVKDDLVTLDDERVPLKPERPQSAKEENPVKEGKVLIRLWYVLNMVCLVLFGFVHQGGVYPLCGFLHSQLQAKPHYMKLHLVTSHTYSLPLHLLSIKANGYKRTNNHFQSHELGSDHFENIHLSLLQVLNDAEQTKQRKRKLYKVYYALPTSLYHEFLHSYQPFKFNYTYVIEKVFYPHFSGEAPPSLLVNATEPLILDTDTDSVVLALTHSLPVQYMLHFLKQFGFMIINIQPTA